MYSNYHKLIKLVSGNGKTEGPVKFQGCSFLSLFKDRAVTSKECWGKSPEFGCSRAFFVPEICR